MFVLNLSMMINFFSTFEEAEQIMRSIFSEKAQLLILNEGSREEIISWLVWNDPNGCYTDSDSISEDKVPLTFEEAQQIMRNFLLNEEWV